MAPCTEAKHKEYNKAYRAEGLPSYADEKGNLFNQHCADCNKKFVGHSKPGPEEVQPNHMAPAWFCVDCDKKARLGYVEKIHCFCYGCFTPRLEECGKTPDSPRKQRQSVARINYKE